MATTPDTQIVPIFKHHTVLNEAMSKKKGRPIFDDVEIVELRFPGDRGKVLTFPAHEAEPNATRESIAAGGGPVTYAELYSRQYSKFKDMQAQDVAGTPLDELPFLTAARRSELRALNVHTAEQLAALDGQPLRQLGMGGRELKNQATAYLARANGTADVTQMAAEVADLRRQLEEARAQNASPKQAKQAEAEPEADDAEQDEEGDDDGEEDYQDLEDMPDAKLKQYIKRETGEPVRGNPSRETLLKRAARVANGQHDDEGQDDE